MRALDARPPAVLLVPVFAMLYAAAIGASVIRDRVGPRDRLQESVLYLRSPKTLDRMVLSYDALAADIYWMRALQHFGANRLAKSGKYELLYPLLDITTTLDPKFNIAYRFGAIFLSEPPPGGPGRPDQAIALLGRGLEVRPDRWQYMQDIGFVHYTWRRDYAAAAEWFEKASTVPGAPWWLKSLAATTRATGGDRAGARALWTAIQQSATDNEWLRNDATRRLQQLDAMDTADELQRIVYGWLATRPPKPYTWQAMVRAGRLRGVPVDPTGTVFALASDTGIVSVGPESTLRPLPNESAPSASQ